MTLLSIHSNVVNQENKINLTSKPTIPVLTWCLFKLVQILTFRINVSCNNKNESTKRCTQQLHAMSICVCWVGPCSPNNNARKSPLANHCGTRGFRMALPVMSYPVPDVTLYLIGQESSLRNKISHGEAIYANTRNQSHIADNCNAVLCGV